MSDNLRQTVEENAGVDIGLSDQQAFWSAYFAGTTALAGYIGKKLTEDSNSILDPRERMSRQLLNRGHASVDEIMKASYGEWPPKGLDVVSENSQRVTFGNIIDRSMGLKEATGPFAGLRGKVAAVMTIGGDATTHGDRVIRMNPVLGKVIPGIMGRSALASTLGHEGVHIMQGDNFYRAGQVYGYHNAKQVFDHQQMVFGNNDTLAKTFQQHASPDLVKSTTFNYLSSGIETQARIHEVMAAGYQKWGQLPANREQFLVAMDSAGMDVPKEIMQELENSPTIEQTRAIFDKGKISGGEIRDINRVQNGLTDAGKVELWNKAMPEMYVDLIEMYGDGPGRARFDMGVNMRAQMKADMAAAGGPMAVTYDEYKTAARRGDPNIDRMVKPGVEQLKPNIGDTVKANYLDGEPIEGRVVDIEHTQGGKAIYNVDMGGGDIRPFSENNIVDVARAKPQIIATKDVPKPGDKLQIDYSDIGMGKTEGTHVKTVAGADGKPLYQVDFGDGDIKGVSPVHVTEVERMNPKVVATQDVPKPGDRIIADYSDVGFNLKQQGTYVETIMGDDGKPLYRVDFGGEVMNVSPDHVVDVKRSAPKVVATTDVPNPGDRVTADYSDVGFKVKQQGTYVETIMGDDGKPVYRVDFGDDISNVSPDHVVSVDPAKPKVSSVDIDAEKTPIDVQIDSYVAERRALAETRYEIKNGSLDGFKFDDDAKTKSLMREYEKASDKAEFRTLIEGDTAQLAQKRQVLGDFKQSYTEFQDNLTKVTGAPPREVKGTGILSRFDRTVEDGGLAKVQQLIDGYNDVSVEDLEKYTRAETALRVDARDPSSPSAIRGSIWGHEGAEIKQQITESINEYNKLPGRAPIDPSDSAGAQKSTAAVGDKVKVDAGGTELVEGRVVDIEHTQGGKAIYHVDAGGEVRPISEKHIAEVDSAKAYVGDTVKVDAGGTELVEGRVTDVEYTRDGKAIYQVDAGGEVRPISEKYIVEAGTPSPKGGVFDVATNEQGKIMATYGAYEEAVNRGDPVADRMQMPAEGYDGKVVATYDEYVDAVNAGDPAADKMVASGGSDSVSVDAEAPASSGGSSEATKVVDATVDAADDVADATADAVDKAADVADDAKITASSADVVADASKGVDLGGVGKHVNGIAGVGLGVVAGAATYAFTDASLSEAGEVSFEIAVPYGEVATELAAGDTHGAVKAGMTETAGIVGAVALGAKGAALGAAVGSVVPVVGTAVGAVVGGVGGAIVGGVGAGMGTDYVLTKVPEVVDAVHDGISATMDAVGVGSDTVKAGYEKTLEVAGDLKNQASETISSGWSQITSFFNDEANPETAVAEAGKDLTVEQAQEILAKMDPDDPALQDHPEVASLVQVAKSDELFAKQFKELGKDGVSAVSQYVEDNPVKPEEPETQDVKVAQQAPDPVRQQSAYDGMAMS